MFHDSTDVNFPGPDWRAVIDAIPAPALALDSGGVVVHANHLLSNLFPRARSGQHIAQLNRSPELLQAVQAAGTSDEPVVVQVLDRVPLERRLSAVITRMAAVPEALLLLTFRDETEQEKLAQMRADFIAHASHELRTPLASLKGSIETLQGAARDDALARERFLTLMETQAARMSRLIDDLLILSRAEMHVHMPPTDAVDLNELLSFTVQSLEPVAASKEIVMTVKRSEGTALVTADREELMQVFQNLVQNAIKYGHKGGRIDAEISSVPPTAVHGPRYAVSVRDDGPGIAEHHIPRLTERFYRVSPAASRVAGGTGLGLAIVKHIVTRHRGDLTISSKIGVGSTFTVLLHQRPSQLEVKRREK
ncbi:MAG: hypothetical protein RLZ98_1210 [Pseudomonadota bacterium]|jgi:two-component system phosphate regulon sensor histidine kinase PhoR